jgi:hypothetical protein
MYPKCSKVLRASTYGTWVKSTWIRCPRDHDANLSPENIAIGQNKFEQKRRFLSVSAFPPLQKLFLPQRGASQ